MRAKKTSISPMHLVLVILLAILTTLLLIRLVVSTEPVINNSTIIPRSEDHNLDSVPVEDQSQALFGSTNVKVPAGWTISALLKSPVNSGYECGVLGCKLIGILGNQNSDATLARITISYPGAVSVPEEVDTITEDLVMNFAGEQVKFTARRYRLVDLVPVSAGEDQVEERVNDSEVVYYQVFGCNSKQVCIQAGPLLRDQQQNQQQLAELQNFLSQLSFL